MKPVLFSAAAVLLAACRTTLSFAEPDLMSADITNPAGGTGENITVRIIEKPVYIVADSPEFDQLVQEEAGRSGLPEDIVAGKIAEGTTDPSDQFARWDGVILEYDYDPGFIYHIYSSPFRITDIELEPGETLTGEIITGDSGRWMIESGIVGDQAHIYLKPTITNLETSMIINTNRRRYYLVIRSYNQKYMVGVRWRYPRTELARALENTQGLPMNTEAGEIAEDALGIPVLGNQMFNLYSFDYKVRYPKRLEVRWIPVRVYDDGTKTFIELPQDALNFELPVIHLGKRKKDEIVNYRVVDTTMVIDKLITDVTLSLDKSWATISKKVK